MVVELAAATVVAVVVVVGVAAAAAVGGRGHPSSRCKTGQMKTLTVSLQIEKQNWANPY